MEPVFGQTIQHKLSLLKCINKQFCNEYECKNYTKKDDEIFEWKQYQCYFAFQLTCLSIGPSKFDTEPNQGTREFLKMVTEQAAARRGESDAARFKLKVGRPQKDPAPDPEVVEVLANEESLYSNKLMSF